VLALLMAAQASQTLRNPWLCLALLCRNTNHWPSTRRHAATDVVSVNIGQYRFGILVAHASVDSDSLQDAGAVALVRKAPASNQLGIAEVLASCQGLFWQQVQQQEQPHLLAAQSHGPLSAPATHEVLPDVLCDTFPVP
jgi:hypothetical protein